MQTLQLQIQDDLYESIKDMSIDINEKFQEFLYNLVDDGYPMWTLGASLNRACKYNCVNLKK